MGDKRQKNTEMQEKEKRQDKETERGIYRHTDTEMDKGREPEG